MNVGDVDKRLIVVTVALKGPKIVVESLYIERAVRGVNHLEHRVIDVPPDLLHVSSVEYNLTYVEYTFEVRLEVLGSRELSCEDFVRTVLTLRDKFDCPSSIVVP